MAIFKTTADYYKNTEYFRQYNCNPAYTGGNNWQKADCVIRAFAKTAGITWLDAFDILSKRARETYDVPNSMNIYSHVLLEYGFKKHTLSAVKGQKRITVEDFCKIHSKGRFCVKVANHLTSVVNGICYDHWNPANKCVYGYYELPEKLYNKK